MNGDVLQLPYIPSRILIILNLLHVNYNIFLQEEEKNNSMLPQILIGKAKLEERIAVYHVVKYKGRNSFTMNTELGNLDKLLYKQKCKR